MFKTNKDFCLLNILGVLRILLKVSSEFYLHLCCLCMLIYEVFCLDIRVASSMP